MCGIAAKLSERRYGDDRLVAMVERLHHRGPDSDGYFRDGRFHAGMRRLAINDPAHGDQPLFDASRNVALLYNGEIYNYRELRAELETKGYRFRTTCDGEVICHLYHEKGEDLFEHLDGMFAAALWVRDEQKLLLARDLPGEKPLYYSRPRGDLVFASELSALMRFPEVDATLDRQALWDFPTFLWVPEPATVYREVSALERGHVLVAQAGRVTVRPYRNRFNREPLVGTGDEAVIAETRAVVETAVRSRLLSDVGVGSFLSSGLDSSIVATVAARALGRIETFSVAFEDVSDPYHGRADESAEAERYAARIGANHHTIRVSADSFRAELDRFVDHGDGPFAVSSGLGILAVARAAREAGVKVLLSGDGADECFGGYSWYPSIAAKAEPRPPSCKGPVSFQNFGLDLDTRLATLAGYAAAERAWAWHYYAHESEKQALFAPDWGEGAASSLRHFSAFRAGEDWAPETYVAQDRDFYLPNEMLRKVDRMTMAYSVEGRVPFTAPAVLSHADKLAFRHMVRGTSLKWVLRQAFADVLPAEVVERPKHGFNVPIDHWLKNEWSDLLEDAFASGSALRRHGIVAAGAGDTARRMLASSDRLNGHTLFCFIVLNRWLERMPHGNHR
jgi:asparagine synthase (glutamine-hydrolysing)